MLSYMNRCNYANGRRDVDVQVEEQTKALVDNQTKTYGWTNRHSPTGGQSDDDTQTAEQM